jgi:hypothetical protein
MAFAIFLTTVTLFTVIYGMQAIRVKARHQSPRRSRVLR